MPTASGNKTYFNFVKGIITEASPLLFPESASIDEDNFLLNRDGSRQRRLGIDYEDDFVLKDTGDTYASLDNAAFSVLEWESVNNDPTLSFGVVQVGNKLWFVDLFKGSLTSNFYNSGSALTLAGAGTSPIQAASINGQLVVTGGDFDPIYLAYNSGTDTITSNTIDFKIRDFYGIVDSLATSERPLTLSAEHKYNLLNQGWTETNMDDYFSSTYGTWASSTGYAKNVRKVPTIKNGYFYKASVAGTTDTTEPTWPTVIGEDIVDGTATWVCWGVYNVYPSNADIMHLAKDAVDEFDVDLLTKQFFGNSNAPKGSFIIDAFSRGSSRTTESGISGLPLDSESGHITTVASFAGRVFYSGVQSSITDGDERSPDYSGAVFFTKIVNSKADLGVCYQDADPTSEHISDLVATDGGYIPIPEASNILRLSATDRSLIVVAENGVWELTGSFETGFSAADYQVNRISSVGATNAESVVDAEGVLVYWADGGIYMLQRGEGGYLTAVNVTAASIQTLYDGIVGVAKSHVVGEFDSATRKITWKYNDTDDYDGSSYVNKYNRELVYDTMLQAFYPNTIAGATDSTYPFVAGSVTTPNFVVADYVSAVLVSGDQVQANSIDVVITEGAKARGTSYTKQLTIIPNAAGNALFTFSHYRNGDFIDWELFDTVGVDYSSFLLTGYEIAGDSTRWKQTPYITFHLMRTEDGFEEVGGVLQETNPSSCLVTPHWNFADHANSGKIGRQFQAYRYKRNYIVEDVNDTLAYGVSVITTKNKLRGKGKALSLRIESETGKDMHLLGWGIPFIGAQAV